MRNVLSVGRMHGLGAVLLTTLTLLALPRVVAAQQAWSPVADGFPRTPAELSNFEVNTDHQAMWDYMEALRGASTEVRLGSYGKTWEGRDLAYAVFSRPLVSEPWEAWALGRPVVVLGANVHGGERTFREGLLILMRDLATPGTAPNALLDKVTVVVAPQLNPDGYEASDRGTRGNAWGIDLNRDYVKLEQPALANYVQNVLEAWRPDVMVDGHNGCSQPYNLCYQCPSHYDPAQEITALCDENIFPAINERLASEGLQSWYYSGGNEEEWRGGGSEARIGRNYAGFINTIGILFEAPSQGAEEGARAGYLGYLTVVQYAAEHAEQVMSTVKAAQIETLAMGEEPRGEIAVQMEYAPEDYPVSYTLIQGGGRNNPDAPRDTIEVTGARLMKKPVATKLRPRPWAYLLPRDAVDAVALLRKHGITVEVLQAPADLQVDAYTVAGVTYERAYNHAAATRVEVGEVLTLDQSFPKGTYVIPTAQLLGRLAAHMLEPETPDNVVYWNTMDAWIPHPDEGTTEGEEAENAPRGGPPAGAAGPPTAGGGPPGGGFMQGRGQQGPPVLPIYKLMTPTPLPTLLLEEGR